MSVDFLEPHATPFLGRNLDGFALLDGDDLRRNLTALARASHGDNTKLKAEALQLIKSAFNEARETVRQRVESGVSPGLAAARALSVLQDVTIQVLYDFATRHIYRSPNPTESERLAIIATGGYGRGLMAPGSDVDLLFLHPFKLTSWSESIVEYILHTLWDLGLKVGHATRSLDECVRLGKQDITIRTSLLEARYIWGDEALSEDLHKRFWDEIAVGNGQDFVTAKLHERDVRHTDQGQSRYLVEPNVKEGKGGLRDLQTLYWIGKYIYKVEDPIDLVRHGVFTDSEYNTFQKAEAFLWSVRCNLHYLAKRAEERLSFDMQPELAKRLGYFDPKPRRAVERFMRSYFLAAKDVGDLTRIFCAALEEQYKKPAPVLTRLLPGFLKARNDDDDFYAENGRLRARKGAFRSDPVNLIRLFQVADTKDVDIHPRTLRTVTRSLDLIDESLRGSSDANKLFMEILTSRRDPETALRRMNEAGVLGKFMPEFGRVVALMQFNMYHHYTVDEHLLVALGVTARIERGELKKEFPLASELIKRVKSREVLFMTMLLHDMAKGLPGDHSDLGAELAEVICPRVGMSAADTATVAWLVKYHLLMSDTAQKRDVSDPKTVRDFASIVQTPERLRLLLLVTVCDIRAVGPGVWNDWKGQLLRDLYTETETLMSGGDSIPTRSVRMTKAKNALLERISDLPEKVQNRAVSRHYDTYWLAFDTDGYEFQARTIAEAEEKKEPLALGSRGDALPGVTEFVVFAGDHPGLFARLAGAFSVSGASIVDAKIFTTSDGYALGVFRVRDPGGGTYSDPYRVERLKEMILKTLRGDILPRSVLAERPMGRRESAFEVPLKINFDNEASGVSTVVEVESHDKIGLVYEITRTLSDLGLSISSAIITTYGELAVDVFYVRDGFGHKVIRPSRLEQIEKRLKAALEA